ncbi:hypothetical protein SLEP1_g47317 [Rubroshorea leprosula]|uniref:Uncharacterized protein n=1 Tax=Rubroshorea leprosula TaxID=152421 RepID=A0AAV5LQ17_9ROSI|nr:hypothetical protein SLEP1_g47317 [Rubroshorea leprosula]
MGQIVKRKKKGRPSKADLARRGVSPATGPESEPRRSLRRRNVRYNIDYDDYLDEDFEEDEEEEERGREKKLKLVVKLNQSGEVATAEATLQSRGREAARARDVGKDEEGEEEEEDEEEEFERKKVKKRRINGGDEEDDDVDDEDDDGRGAEVCTESMYGLAEGRLQRTAPGNYWEFIKVVAFLEQG